MNTMLDKSLRLGIIGAVAALLLAVVNNFTEPVIADRKVAELEAALTVLASGGKPGIGELTPAEGVFQRWSIDSDQGWILSLDAVGYGGPMNVVASYTTSGTVMVARLLDNTETVGFGKKAENTDYMKIFVGTGGAEPVPVDKAALGADVDVVSGATVTFGGIANAIAHGSEIVRVWEGQ